MHRLRSSFAFAALLAVITTSSLHTQPLFALAAPVGTPSSPSSSISKRSANECQQCLITGLLSVPKCENITKDTPGLPAEETDTTKIQTYKSQNPDVVDCLCRASHPPSDSSNWISACDKVCSPEAKKQQEDIMRAVSKQLSCNADAGLPKSPAPMPPTASVTPPSPVSMSPPPKAEPDTTPSSADILPTSPSIQDTQGQDKPQQAQTPPSPNV
ncbi:MAG: hypothetical protein BYD32DRAFT_435399 [Podila humilis]|nr:MAG: hypothetical protein BYD32DRAFT_435399 [Podila humilis]